MILGFPRAKQGLCHTKHGGAGGIILWALLTVFLVLLLFLSVFEMYMFISWCHITLLLTLSCDRSLIVFYPFDLNFSLHWFNRCKKQFMRWCFGTYEDLFTLEKLYYPGMVPSENMIFLVWKNLHISLTFMP